jgi:hypothetical protein
MRSLFEKRPYTPSARGGIGAAGIVAPESVEWGLRLAGVGSWLGLEDGRVAWVGVPGGICIMQPGGSLPPSILPRPPAESLQGFAKVPQSHSVESLRLLCRGARNRLAESLGNTSGKMTATDSAQSFQLLTWPCLPTESLRLKEAALGLDLPFRCSALPLPRSNRLPCDF